MKNELKISTSSSEKIVLSGEIKKDPFKINEFITYAYALLKVKPENMLNKIEIDVFVGFIIENYSKYSIENLKLAYRMAHAGKLDEFSKEKLNYPVLTTTNFGEIMKAFEKYRNHYNARIKPIEEQKSIAYKVDRERYVEEFFEEYKLTNKVNDFATKLGVFKWIKENFDIESEIISKDKALELGKNKLKNSYQKKFNREVSHSEKKKIKRLIENFKPKESELHESIKMVVIEAYYLKRLNEQE